MMDAKRAQKAEEHGFLPDHGQGQQVLAGNILLFFLIIIHRHHIIKLNSYIFILESIYNISIKMLIIHLFLIKY